MRASSECPSTPQSSAADPSKQLIEAVERLDVDETRRLLEVPSVDPNLPDPNGRTAIFNVLSAQSDLHDENTLAFEERRARVLSELLRSPKVHTGHRDNDGQTILLAMVQQRLNTLLEKSLHVVHEELLNASDHEGRTALSWAAGNADQGAARALLGYGASVDLEDDDKRSPLSWALSNITSAEMYNPYNARRDSRPSSPSQAVRDTVDQVLPAIETLLEHKASVYKEDILMTVIESCHIQLVEAVFAYVSLHRVLALELPSKIVLFFLQNVRENMRLHVLFSSMLSERDFKRRTLLHSAAWRGHRDIVLELLSQGAELDPTDVDGATPLKLAIRDGQVDVVTILLNKGAEVAGISGNDWRECLRRSDNEEAFLVLTEEGLVREPSSVTTQSHRDGHEEEGRIRRHFQLVSDLKHVKTPFSYWRRLL